MTTDAENLNLFHAAWDLMSRALGPLAKDNPYLTQHAARMGAHSEKPWPVRICSLTHDILEDAPEFEDELRALLPAAMFRTNEALCRHRFGRETYRQSVVRASKDPTALEVKLLDIDDHIEFADAEHQGMADKRYRPARDFLAATIELRDLNHQLATVRHDGRLQYGLARSMRPYDPEDDSR